MQETDQFLFALAHTQVIVPPRQLLETFGNTVIHYHLLAETMDRINEVRVREGKIQTERPQLLSPAYFEQLMLEGFSEEAHHYASWLRDHVQDLTFLKYGFRFRKLETQESLIHEPIETAVARVKQHVEDRADPLTAVIQGVDEGWEFCLLKFTTDFIRKSIPRNVRELQKHGVVALNSLQEEEIEALFEKASEDSSLFQTLSATLQKHGLFEKYEDRFFELIRRSRR